MVAGLKRKMRGRSAGRVAMIAVIASLLVPRGAFPQRSDPPPVAGKVDPGGKGTGKHVSLGLDDGGNVMLRYGGVSLTLIYGPEEGGDAIRERGGSVPPLKEALGVGEVSFKVGFAF